MFRALGAFSLVVIVGCGPSGRPRPGEEPDDLATQEADLATTEKADLAMAAKLDLATAADLTGMPSPDLTGMPSPDLANMPQPDIAKAPDLANVPQPDIADLPLADLANMPQPDLANVPPPDLANLPPPDIAMAPRDLARPVDLVQPADLVAPPDLAMPGCPKTCPQGCTMGGVCTPGGVTCAPGSRRCFGPVVQLCNDTGSSWLDESVCAGGCANGLCTGACTAGQSRCNGSVREVCAMNGMSWNAAEQCNLGCASGVCVEAELNNQGNPLTMQGTKVYLGCVAISLGGSITVPAGQTLEIIAKCITMSASASIFVGANATLRVRVTENADLAGTISGGKEVFLQAKKTMTNTGKVTSSKVTLRSNLLTNGNGGATSGADTAALYGGMWTNMGMHAGAVSVMPPERIASSTHPEGMWLNLNGAVDLAWERPFPGVLGYYVSVGDTVPGPGKGALSVTEAAELPPSAFVPGANRVRVVSVNGNSIVGTYPVDFTLQFNVRSPTVTSMSHPVEGQWGGVKDVFFAWTDPPGPPQGTFTGYYWVFDHQADTIPNGNNGTFTTNKSLLLPGQANGVWYFHLVNIDKMGRTSPLVSHYQVRVGANPGSGNIAGTVTDAMSGKPIVGARVSLNGGLLDAFSGKTGDYTFTASVPITNLAYRVTASAPGYKPIEVMVTVDNMMTKVQNFALSPGPAPMGYAMGWEVQVWNQNARAPSVAVGPRGKYIWSSVGAYAIAFEKVAIVRSSGDEVMSEQTYDQYAENQGSDVGWNGSAFWAVDNYRCGYDQFISYGQGWSAERMKTWDATGKTLANWLPWRNSGQTSSASAVWRGDGWGVFFVSYDKIYEKDFTPDVKFASGDSTTHTALPGVYGDTRESSLLTAVPDGPGYAIAYFMNNGVGGANLWFARYARNLMPTQAPISLDPTWIGGPIGLVYDGTNYHVSYRRGAGPYDLVVKTITPAGDATQFTKVATLPMLSNPNEQLSLAFDGRYLVVVHVNADVGTLEARLPTDRSVVFKQVLGPMRTPRVAFNRETGEGAVLYTRPDKTGTFLRPFAW